MWFGVLCLLTVVILKILLNYNRSVKFPPGPRGLPIIGNVLNIVKLVKEAKCYSNVWCRLYEMYGPVVGLRLGFDEPLIIVSGKAAITEMLHRSEFDGRPNGFLFKYRSGGTRQGLLFTDTNVWHSQRRFTLKTLKEFGFGKQIMEHVLQEDAIMLTNIVTELTKTGTPTSIQSIISAAVLSNLWLLIDGTKTPLILIIQNGSNTANLKSLCNILGVIRVNNAKGTWLIPPQNSSMESPMLKEAINILKDLTSSSNVMGGILNQFPFLRYLFPHLTGFSVFAERQSRINSFFMNIISKHKETMNETKHECTNFIDAYLQEIETRKTSSSSSFFNENQLAYVVKDLFAAGVDTTDNTIGFVIAFLIVHQDVQMKMHEEIDRVIGRDTYPSLNDCNRLPYLKAILSEVWRLANIGPTSIPHRAIIDSNLLGFEIKKNYTLLANLKSVHMDKEHWGDSEVFRPERFIDSKGQFVEDSWLMPFGLGRRKCLGETVARQTTYLFVACLLQRLHFKLPLNHPKPRLQGTEGFVVMPPKLDIIAVQRY